MYILSAVRFYSGQPLFLSTVEMTTQHAYLMTGYVLDGAPGAFGGTPVHTNLCCGVCMAHLGAQGLAVLTLVHVCGY